MRSGVSYTKWSAQGLCLSLTVVTMAVFFLPAEVHADTFLTEAGNTASSSPSGSPDIIVGDIYEIQFFGALPDGRGAFSIGTVSCNKGTGPANWIWNTPDHPVIAQHFYRLHQNRFEQIGMSWVKHGFFAQSQTLCSGPGGCAGDAGGMRLGPGCSDAYSASLNGQIGNLGPRSDINAFTGEFPYPFNAPPSNILIGRRIVVEGQDYLPEQNIGARFFAEGHYITKDDAEAGAQHNNASYRPINIFRTLNSSLSVELLDETIRTKPAIRAWRASDPGVVETDIYVPGDGLFILAAKATDLGGDQWAYEYALHNLNVHRSADRFSIPIDAMSILTDVGFHDVNYHSGEIYDGTDWTVTQSVDAVSWATDTFAFNPEANALRWGTLYNFRFYADAPPVATPVTISLFRPGPIDTVTALTIGPARSIIDCNGNGFDDLCDIDCNSVGLTCDQITCGTSSDVNANAIPDECEPDCDNNGVPDTYDVTLAPSSDCNGNLVPDTCEVDTDGDGVIDVCDPCPLDMFDDSDGDGVCDSDDPCPFENPDDADQDGLCFPADQCPNDALKIAAGFCGCGMPETDSDADGTPDCVDECPANPNKISAGVCGCSTPDADSDGDGIADCQDQCPGVSDLIDLDNNGTSDCAEHIPTVSTWGLVVLALMLLTAGKLNHLTRREYFVS